MPLDPAQIRYQEQHINETTVPRLVTVFVICFVISYVAIILRLLSRRLSKVKLGTDDWLILLSALFTTAFLSVNIYLTQIGLGRHAILIKAPKSFVLGYTLLEVLYTITIFIIKLSTLYLWHRIFPGRSFTISLYIIGGVLCAYSITQMVCVVTQCVPLSSLWDPSIKGRCIDLDTVFVVCSSFNIATDLGILILPLFPLWNLNVKTKRKLQILVMFCLGGFVLIISIIRVPQLLEISQTDQSWTLSNSAIWTSLECAVATLSACLPTMRPIFSRMIGHGPKAPRSATYMHSKSSKPTRGGRARRLGSVDDSMADTQPFAEEAEGIYLSDIKLKGKITKAKLELPSLDATGGVPTMQQPE